jgi:hypothetical protein
MSYRTTKFSCILITYKSKNKIGSQNKCSKGEPAMEIQSIPNLGVCDTAVYQKQQTGENYLHQAKETMRDMTCTAEST